MGLGNWGATIMTARPMARSCVETSVWPGCFSLPLVIKLPCPETTCSSEASCCCILSRRVDVMDQEYPMMRSHEGFTSTSLSAMRGAYSGTIWSSGWLECRLTLFQSHRFIRNVCGGLEWKVIFWFASCTWRMGYIVEKASCNSRDLPQKLVL